MTERQIVNPEVFEALREVMEDDFSLVVDAFYDQATQLWPDAAIALASGEHEVLERLAHGLKGSALSLGAEQLSDTLESLERAARNQDVSSTEAQHQAAEARLAEALSWVTSAMA